LGLPLCQIHSKDDGPDVVYYSFEPRGEVRWLHIVKANDWVVVPHVAHRCAAHGVVLKNNGAEQPLPKHILQTKNKSLMTDDDLHRLQKHLRLATEASPMPKTDSLIESLAQHYECDAADCLANFMATEEEPNCLHEDPLAEAVFNDLDAGDKKEFEDYGEAIKKRKIRIARKRANVEKQAQALGRPAKRQRSARGKGKGRGRGAGPDSLAPAVEYLPETRFQARNAEEHNRGANVLPVPPEWNPVECASCRGTAGIYKLYPNPGARDNPTWVMRCVDPCTNKFGERTPYNISSVTAHMSEDDVK